MPASDFDQFKCGGNFLHAVVRACEKNPNTWLGLSSPVHAQRPVGAVDLGIEYAQSCEERSDSLKARQVGQERSLSVLLPVGVCKQ